LGDEGIDTSKYGNQHFVAPQAEWHIEGVRQSKDASKNARIEKVTLLKGFNVVLSALKADFQVIFKKDPAARNWLEVMFCYPGLQALLFHRVAHWLWVLGLPFAPRFLSHLGRFFTGIEIHPGATIGQGVFIDHGMGVVIGETAIIGDNCLIYQGVTLGGTGKETGKRHPTLGENVVVGTGAKVLGNLQIGNNVRIGANSVVLRDVPSDCTVVGVPGRIVYRAGTKVDPLEHGRLPDSEAQAIRYLVDRIESLEAQVRQLQQEEPAEINQAELKAQLELLVGNAPAAQSCRISDRALEQFLDGSGI
jgi:serine O-acetyltransferase